jgi:predicted nuclease of predicted toxin-antitoxin system
MSLRFYTDSHIPEAVATQLRLHGVDVVRCQDIKLDDATDLEHLEYATEQGMAIITKDSDFPSLHKIWMQQNRRHCGIFFCPYRNEPATSLIVTACLFYHQAIEDEAGTLEDDIHNRLHYIT